MRRAATILAVAALVMMGCSDTKDDEGGGVGAPLPAGVWAPTVGLAFADAPRIPAVSKPGVKDVSVTLDVREQTIAVNADGTGGVSGSALGVVAFAGKDDTEPGSTLSAGISGPTLHVTPGGKITVNFINGTQQDTNIHYHGLHVSPSGDSDNVFRVMAPSPDPYTSVVELPANHPVGTYWYHVHHHGNSDYQVLGGLSGLLIVEGVETTLPTNLENAEQHQFALREVMTKDDHVIKLGDKKSDAVTRRLVNGLLSPKLSVPQGSFQLWRFANIGADFAYSIPVPAGLVATIVAEDGNPLFVGQKEPTTTLVLPPGKRLDVSVFTGLTAGEFELTTPATSLEKTDQVRAGQALLATVVVGETVVPALLSAPMVVTDTDSLPDDGLRTSRRDRTPDMERTFTFSFGPPGTAMIAGEWIDPDTGLPVTFGPKVFDHDVIDVKVKLGDLEKWTLINTTTQVHPFHIHVNEFEVIGISNDAGVIVDVPPRGTSDVVNIPAGTAKVENTTTTKDANGQPIMATTGKLVVLNEFLDFTGLFVFHCHILAHEDIGMMASIEVLGPPLAATTAPGVTVG